MDPRDLYLRYTDPHTGISNIRCHRVHGDGFYARQKQDFEGKKGPDMRIVTHATKEEYRAEMWPKK